MIMQRLKDRILDISCGIENFIVALDGRCCAGKTTLAKALADDMGWGVLHMDDFYLTPEQRTPERMAQPGGNIDYTRVLTLLDGIRAGQAVEYRPFCCKTLSFKAPVGMAPCGVTILEGAYACHPQLWDMCHLHVFLDVEKGLQRERVLSRNPDTAQAFFDTWIPREERYISAFEVDKRADLLMRADGCAK